VLENSKIQRGHCIPDVGIFAVFGQHLDVSSNRYKRGLWLLWITCRKL